MNHKVAFAALGLTAGLFTALAGAQWLEHPSRGIPRLPNGRPNLSAPVVRLADGKIDLSGLWQLDAATSATRGPQGAVLSPYYVDVTADMKQDEVPFLPWAEAEYKRRLGRQSRDDPAARCQPYGVPAAGTYPAPFKIVHTADLLVILYEANTTFRQVFLDGRQHPREPQPTWMGYSTGQWDGDTLVVTSAGFNDRSWLDRRGHPHTESLRVTERFRRADFGHLEVGVMIEDPGAYTRPLTFTQRQELLVDSELLEHFCTENEKFNSQIR